MTASIIEASSLFVRFGGLVALDNVSMAVNARAIHGLIGPNGAGKTTLFNALSGITPNVEGSIAFDGMSIENLPSWRRANLGIARTFQNIRLFSDMSVLETVLAGMTVNLRQSVAAVLTRSASFRRSEREALSFARDVLSFVGISGVERRRSGDLSYGDQRRLEIARALASRPRLLLLDEPAAGMNPSEKKALADLLRRIAAQGPTILVVEHDMPFVMSLCERITVLNFGRVIFDGAPDEARKDQRVIQAYLGVESFSDGGAI